jgi:hypothetical protein
MCPWALRRRMKERPGTAVVSECSRSLIGDHPADRLFVRLSRLCGEAAGFPAPASFDPDCSVRLSNWMARGRSLPVPFSFPFPFPFPLPFPLPCPPWRGSRRRHIGAHFVANSSRILSSCDCSSNTPSPREGHVAILTAADPPWCPRQLHRRRCRCPSHRGRQGAAARPSMRAVAVAATQAQQSIID